MINTILNIFNDDRLKFNFCKIHKTFKKLRIEPIRNFNTSISQ